MLKRKSKANSLETAVRKAIQRVKSNFNQQQRLYREIERNLQGSSAKNFNL
jgi:Trm5-related predicted tRNA methylase